MISHDCKIIYIHIPKCAGRSISHAFNQHFDHYTASYYETQYPQQWNEYSVFTTVRNPYQRLVSMYHYIKNEPFHAGHAITNFGNMPLFKTWVGENINAFQGEFTQPSTEGNREEDGQMGSSFWFSSQVNRITSACQNIYNNIRIFRYEDGMLPIQNFVQHTTGMHLPIPHINRSHADSQNRYLHYYDQDLLNLLNVFPPFIKDCAVLNYEIITNL